MQDHPNCCNDNCNQGRDCLVRAGTHKPAEALLQIQEPDAAEQAAWFAGLDEGRAQAAPAAVAVPDELRALLATGGQGQAVRLLAEDHSGMKVDYRGLFSQVQRAIKRTDPGYAEMLRQLEDHLQELGQRWYAGDTDVVDEILQLYCIERDARKTVATSATAAPQQADARDAEHWRHVMKCLREEAFVDRAAIAAAKGE